MVKNLPAVQETWVWSLGWEDPLEKGMATHSNIFACRVLWTEETGKLQSRGLQRVGYHWETKHIAHKNGYQEVKWERYKLGDWNWHIHINQSVSSVVQSCPTPCDPMNCITPGLPVHHQLPESTQTHVHWVSDAIQPYHPLSSPSPPALNLSQHQGLFKWVSSLNQVAKVLEFQLQHQSFQWIFWTKFL